MRTNKPSELYYVHRAFKSSKLDFFDRTLVDDIDQAIMLYWRTLHLWVNQSANLPLSVSFWPNIDVKQKTKAISNHLFVC